MSRHRNVRLMNYDEDYEGYDDVYGHSVEEGDFCVSPATAAQFMFDRTRHDQLSNFVSPSNHPIVETNEDEDDYYEEASPSLSDSSAGLQQTLSALDRAKLNSCIEAMQNIMGETTPESVMVAAALQTGFDPNAATDFIMNQMETPKPQRTMRNRQPRIVRSSGRERVVAEEFPAASAKSSSGAAAAEASKRQQSPTPPKSQPPTENPSAGKKSIPSKGDSKSTVDATSMAKLTKDDGGAQVDTASKPKPPKGVESGAVGDVTTPKPKSAKDDGGASKPKPPKEDESGVVGDLTTPKPKPSKETYGDRNLDSNEFADVGAEESFFQTPRKDLLETASSATPGLHKSASKAKMDRLDVQKEYEKRKAGGKDYINLVVIGHVDAGKSTLMGHVLYQLGFVNKRTMHKYEQDSKKIGKGSFAFAWVLDETEEERSRGVTMDIAQTRFETSSKVVTLLDAPGHKDFIPNMITGAAQADVAILVINAARGEFETGFEMGGQTREHAMLVRSLGVSQLLVAVNKMDTVSWSMERYDEVVKKLGAFLKQTGFKDSEVSFIPCSGLNGENLTKPSQDKQLTSWYKGPSLVDQIDNFRPPERPIIDKPFRMCVSDVFKGMGAGFSVGGIIQAGNIQAGDRVAVIPAAETAVVKNVAIDDTTVGVAFAGDNAILTLTGIDIINTSIGSILCDPLNPIEPTTKFRARIVIFNIEVPITQGFPVVLHYQSVTEQAHIKRLVSQLHKSTGEVIKRKPRCLVKNTNAIVDIHVDRPICIELYRDFKELGRFMLRSSGSTIAAGIVVEILRNKSQANGTS